ncbi:MAG: hypothetical protein IT384_03505 [Deltaproteobacteria bacterium]|nr:hypothetical protein [Deltaproteobacteria bacterium]
MNIGFDKSWTHAAVAFGYPINGLTGAQCVEVREAIAALGEGLIAAPNGDLSPSGMEDAGGPDEPTCFTFVVGSLAVEARVKATQSAGEKEVPFDDQVCAEATRRFEGARARIDEILGGLGVKVNKEPGLLVIAAGPMACASVRAVGDASIARIESDGESEAIADRLDVTYDANPDAEQVQLRGKFLLAVRYS